MSFSTKILGLLPPEFAHNLSIFCLKWSIAQNLKGVYTHDSLKNSIFGLKFKNPIGIAPGFDKNADCIRSLSSFGFGFLELGTVTPKPQPGNQKPRIFRLKEDYAIINCLGFNNKGIDHFKKNILKFNHIRSAMPIGINIGKNKDTHDPIEDYVKLVKEISCICDYIVLNISSPNTAKLRDLQKAEILTELLSSVQNVNPHNKPILIKVAPDINDEYKADIIDLAIKNNIAGIILTNTTIGCRNGLSSAHKIEYGGLSGAPLFELSTKILKQMYRIAGNKLIFIGCGGIQNAQDAYKKIKSGASLVEIYTAFAYQGFGLVNQINKELVTLLNADGFSNIQNAIGSDI